MLIICPNCATSYMIDQAAVGPAGRTVRCARCKASWFAGGPEPAPDVTATVDTVNAEAEVPLAPAARAKAPQPVARQRLRRHPHEPPPMPAVRFPNRLPNVSQTKTPSTEPPQQDPPPSKLRRRSPSRLRSPMRRRWYRRSSPKPPMTRPIPKKPRAKPKVLTPAANGYRRAASNRAGRRAGLRSSSCCWPAMSRWSARAVKWFVTCHRPLHCSRPLDCRSTCEISNSRMSRY